MQNKMRIFLNLNETHYEIFSFDQHKDGSIYCGFPEIENTNFTCSNELPNERMEWITRITSENCFKISLHGSGVVDVKNDPIRIRGNPLIKFDEQTLGIRHLFTGWMSEPKALCEKSPYKNRANDLLLPQDGVDSFVMIFFAIPKSIKIKFEVEFDSSVIMFGPDWDLFSLRYHDILWVKYKIKNSDGWPTKNHIVYSDGCFVPIILEKRVGDGNEEVFVIATKPSYELSENCLSMKLPLTF